MSYLPLITRTFILAVLCVCFSCNPHDGGVNEGTIEFDTRGVDEKHPFYGLAPSSATLKYKNDKFIMEMSTMGMFNTSVIGDLKTKTVAQTVKFMNIKMACVENEKQICEENKDYELNIEETKETRKIAGLKCHKVKVSMVKDPSVTFDAWYTKELGAADCNRLNPYHQVKGMLMDYRLKKMGMEMHFVARSVNHHEIPDNIFDIPAALKIVTREEMQKFFDDLQ